MKLHYSLLREIGEEANNTIKVTDEKLSIIFIIPNKGIIKNRMMFEQSDIVPRIQ